RVPPRRAAGRQAGREDRLLVPGVRLPWPLASVRERGQRAEQGHAADGLPRPGRYRRVGPPPRTPDRGPARRSGVVRPAAFARDALRRDSPRRRRPPRPVVLRAGKAGALTPCRGGEESQEKGRAA